jgi:hypothetical protein
MEGSGVEDNDEEAEMALLASPTIGGGDSTDFLSVWFSRRAEAASNFSFVGD